MEVWARHLEQEFSQRRRSKRWQKESLGFRTCASERLPLARHRFGSLLEGRPLNETAPLPAPAHIEPGELGSIWSAKTYPLDERLDCGDTPIKRLSKPPHKPPPSREHFGSY